MYRTIGLQESRAVAQKPRDAVVIFLSKFTAASRGPPCDSTALVFQATLQNIQFTSMTMGWGRGHDAPNFPGRERVSPIASYDEDCV